MSYEKTTWVNGDLISQNKMNKQKNEIDKIYNVFHNASKSISLENGCTIEFAQADYVFQS